VAGGMRQVAERLVAQGHRQIGVLYDDSKSPDFPQRVGLLRKELGRLGVTLPEASVYGFEEIEPLLQKPDAPTALFCPRDRLAYQLLDLCSVRGIAVPEQLSVVGYDGLPWETISGHTAASVKVNIEALAEAAIACVVAHLGGESTLPLVQYLPTTFVEGTTLGAVPTGTAPMLMQHPVPNHSEVNP
jgi:LacI family transcriptional regulator